MVLHVAPPFSLQKGRHARLVADCLATCSDLLQTEVGDEVSKALIEPDVVPPLHGDQVAEPMVRKLVGNSVGKGEHALSGDLLLKDVQVVEGDHPRVLHGTPLVLVGKDLVVFGEGKIVPEELLKELHGFDGDLEDEGGKLHHMLEEGLHAEQRHRNVLNRTVSTL